ncbi:prolyl oligopeptidase family serine peptidase [Neorhodopirellula pilleata]|uniref:Acetylxylan esterase n=1 Tax=Neorhodopirellula pilleata TaxID=2714738 RepID=A0A5C6AFE8_9BACT|nr:prolyl oligopeptidase family serine peptidase [Neorhodopirellula pilleata]TWT98694.1 Acetylxylan esterase precursor [Neorhodopirellula pilleata]
MFESTSFRSLLAATSVAIFFLVPDASRGLGEGSSAPPNASKVAAFPGPATDWNGYSRYQFNVAGHPLSVVAPETAAAGRPWVWHGEFFGHKPAPDIELLRRGFHIVYANIPNRLGSPSAVEHWNRCYDELTSQYQLHHKVALVGLSRGGLYCYNWAIANPDRVACIYGDAPVCDFRSWPGGLGSGKGSPRDWAIVLQQYGFANDAEAVAYSKNPVDSLAPLARAGVPLLHVFGDADDVVPWDENTGRVAETYRSLGGKITLIRKPGVGHHPHGLEDPTPIVDFIVDHTTAGPLSTQRKPRDIVDKMAQELSPSQLVVYKSVTNPDRGSRELYLHVFEPEGFDPSDQRPCCVIYHGGGWTGGQPQRMYPFAEHFRRLGMVSVSVEYRLHDAERGVTVFDCVADARSAMRFLRANSDRFGIDADKMTTCGGSAGGHLAIATALCEGVDDPSDPRDVSPVPQACVLLFPVIDTSPEGYGAAKIGERWEELSPVAQVSESTPPSILFHGSADTVTPLAGAIAFESAMKQRSIRCDLVVHEGGKHGYLMSDRKLLNETLDQATEFLKEMNLVGSPPEK